MLVLKTSNGTNKKFIGIEPGAKPGSKAGRGTVRDTDSGTGRGLTASAWSNLGLVEFLGVAKPRKKL